MRVNQNNEESRLHDSEKMIENVNKDGATTSKKRKSNNSNLGEVTSAEDLSTTSKRPRRAARDKKKVEQSDESIFSARIFSSMNNDANHNAITVDRNKKPLPTRAKDGTIIFPDFPEFRPNLTPKEVLQRGSFGGTYFRPIYSSIARCNFEDAWQEFPPDWFEGLNVKRQVANSIYDNNVNLYKVHCGADLEEWERSGWITTIDPYGWFQWYCRFYLGRRCSDDYRQISRALGVMGPSGRWRKNLVNKCLRAGTTKEQALNDNSISPKVRQLLQHWAHVITEKDLK